MTEAIELPDHAVLTDLADKVCSVWGVAAPPIEWAETKVAFAHSDGLVMPHRDYWLSEAVDEPNQHYALALLHEVSHWILRRKIGRKVGHVKEFYAFLYALVEEWGEPYGLTPEHARDDEVQYKPRGAKAGWRMFEEVRAA